MRHAFTLALLVLASTTSFAASHQRWDRINCGTCVQTLVDDVNDCSDLRVVFNDREAVRAEEMVTVGEARSLTIRAPQSGGIYVRGTESSRFSVKACKAVEFGELLANVHVNVNGEHDRHRSERERMDRLLSRRYATRRTRRLRYEQRTRSDS